MEKTRNFEIDKLEIKVSEDRNAMGVVAAEEASDKIKELLKEKKEVNIIFAAAPSQNEFLGALTQEKNIDWQRINAFHMDEYIGLPEDHPQRFGNYLRRAIFQKVPFKEVFYIHGSPEDKAEELKRYTRLLKMHPADMVCMGIGENTHIAFNDPGIADFEDKELIKIIQLDPVSRMQQVHDGCFNSLDEVPEFAFTLTVPALMRAPYIFCVVPGPTKAQAVYHTLFEKIGNQFPATILRTHENATLYLDKESAFTYLLNQKTYAKN